ncbi:MAG TPA: hypothetical protein VJ729_12535 [Nitrososphaeraceae archaeon]|nr:hypothetical protein [Nitrososphaeraceae archaeon]
MTKLSVAFILLYRFKVVAAENNGSKEKTEASKQVAAGSSLFLFYTLFY